VIELCIDPEFKALCPPLAAHEYAALEQSIVEEGCRDSIVTWDGTIADGHNRYEICNKHNVPFVTHRVSFKDRQEAKWWIVKNQLARRNMTLVQAAYLRGRVWEMSKQPRNTKGVNLKGGEKVLPQGVRSQQELVGSMLGVSAGKLRNDHDLFLAVERLSERAKGYALSGRELLRHQCIVDLSTLSHETQTDLIARIEKEPDLNLAKVIRALKGIAKPDSRDAPVIRCPTCGVRLARGVTTCLKCDIGDLPIKNAIREASTNGEETIPGDFEERLSGVCEAQIMEEKSDLARTVQFYGGKLVRLLSEDTTPDLDVKTIVVLRKLASRIASIVDLSAKGPKLVGESRYQTAKRHRDD
jgi:hypothetical protein